MVVGYVRCTKMYPCRQSSRADSGVLPACKRRTTSLDVRVCCVRRVEKSCVIICLCTASYNHVSVSSFISWRILWWGWMRSGRDFRRRELHEPRTAGCTACSIARLPESCLVSLSILSFLFLFFTSLQKEKLGSEFTTKRSQDSSVRFTLGGTSNASKCCGTYLKL